MDILAGFFFEKPKVDNKLFGKNYKEHLEKAIEAIEKDVPLALVKLSGEVWNKIASLLLTLF